MRRKRQSPAPASPAKPKEFHFQPFRGLKPIAPKPAPPPPKPVAAPPPPPVVKDEATLFLEAVSGAKRFSPEERQRVAMPAPASEPREVTDPDAEALAELCDLVAGSAPFDVSDSDEYVEGSVLGTDPRLVRRLRNGEFAYQAHLDLHGMTRDEARPAVDRFLSEAHQTGRRCVLIIHGRGLNSKDQVPVLKGLVTAWLARSQWSRYVLAFATARPYDGGAGALYVLLRKPQQRRQALRVTNGSKV